MDSFQQGIVIMSKDKDALALDANSSPGSLDEPPARSIPIVRAISNNPLYIGLGIVVVVLCLFAYIVIDRANANKINPHDIETSDKDKQNINSSASSYQGLIDGIGDGVIDGPVILDPMTDPEIYPEKYTQSNDIQAPLLQDKNLGYPLPFIPNDGLTLQQREQINQVKAERVAQAIFSKTEIQMGNLEQVSGGYGQASERNNNATSTINSYRQQLLDATKSMPGSESSASLGSGGASSSSSDNGYLSQAAGDNSWALATQREAGERYAIKTGAIIPAIMISGVNSDLPGQVVAQVSQNVYDTSTGYSVVIPQGSRLVGQYASNVKLGQDRVMLRWDRIIFPDSSTYDLAGMPGADQMGYSGFKDKVNNHYWKIFGNAFLLSLVSGGYQASLPDSNQNTNNGNLTVQDEISLSMAQQFNEVGGELVRRNLDIQPTIEIRPGYRFTVMVNKDILFNNPYSPLVLK